MNFLHNSIKIVEPLWWKQLMIFINSWVNKHDILVKLLPLSADIFVFSYPLFLVGMYVRWIKKQENYFKEMSLYIFFSAGVASTCNAFIQYFGDKSRPEHAIVIKDNLLLHHLPTDPFPSDHAAVSAAIAMSTLLWWLKYRDTKLLKWSLFFRVACGVMSFSRVAVAIHRPTDILVGVLVGVMSAVVLLSSRVWKWLYVLVIVPLIKLQERMWRVFGL